MNTNFQNYIRHSDSKLIFRSIEVFYFCKFYGYDIVQVYNIKIGPIVFIQYCFTELHPKPQLSMFCGYLQLPPVTKILVGQVIFKELI